MKKTNKKRVKERVVHALFLFLFANEYVNITLSSILNFAEE